MAVLRRGDYGFGRQFINFRFPEGGALVAGVQQNLNDLYPLQLRAGLQTGLVVLEAYPEKDASTAIHTERLELRHPTMGIADPRVDMLAGLEATQRLASGSITAKEARALHRVSELELTMGDPSHRSLRHAINSGEVLWDSTSRQLVTPGLLEVSADHSKALDSVIEELTHYTEGSAGGVNTFLIRQALGALTIKGDRLVLRRGAQRADTVIQLIAKNRSAFHNNQVRFHDASERARFRVVPEVIHDSPESNMQRRRNIAHSSRVRRILGLALSSLTPATVADARRQELIDAVMIADEEWHDELEDESTTGSLIDLDLDW